MRKIINVLQSLKTAYSCSNINVNCVIKYLNQIPYEDVDMILKILFDDSIPISSAFNDINHIITANGYSFYELIRKINEKLIQNKNLQKHIHIIKKLASIEYKIFSNVNSQILILALISSFQI